MRVAFLTFLLLFPVAHSGPCPAGYTEYPIGGDCYQAKTFYNTFATQFTPKTFDEAETECNLDGGGLLASIHNPDDNDALFQLKCSQLRRNIGLRCKGKDCRWDDGSPVDYTNFGEGEEPSELGGTICYTTDGTIPVGAWKQRGCGKQQSDCWVCKVKARTIDCVDGESEYKGGCVSVHSTPLDQKTAEESCPGGGHLVSIHSTKSYSENDFFKKLALDAGITGTVYIGGQFSNGVFEWTDGSHYNIDNWANSFPNTVFGTCVQMLLDSEFGNQGQWTNIDCTVKQPYICFRDGANYNPAPAQPKADAKCPSIQYYTGSGSIFSPNYPLSIPGQQTCEYVLGTKEGTKASVKFSSYNCQSGVSLSLFDGLNSNQPFTTFATSAPSLNQPYTASSNVIKMVFTANGTASERDGKPSSMAFSRV